MKTPGVTDVVTRVSDAAFGKALVTNVLRGHAAEAILSFALEPDWRWCSADYASCDFDRSDGMKIEVKQSAYQQSWAANLGVKPRPGFDVGERVGRLEGAHGSRTAVDPPTSIFFATMTGKDNSADHRDPH